MGNTGPDSGQGQFTNRRNSSVKNIFHELMFDPYPLRTVAVKIIKKFKLGTYEQRLSIGAVDRPPYGYCLYNAAVLARKLGYRQISVVEFGVAGGNGLVYLEYMAQEISKLLAIEIDIYGFDTGEGLPEPSDFRDIPYIWKKGFYRMDIPRLESRLKNAKLVLGDIRDSSANFFNDYNPPPIGAIMYDLDYYSSTVSAMKMLEAGEEYYLPRVFCYFDDIIGSETELYNDHTGERLAICEFNQTHREVKFELPHHLLAGKIAEPWHHRIRTLHFFNHSRYTDFVNKEDIQSPLR